MTDKPYQVIPYEQWVAEFGNRKVDAANTFGFHLFQTARQRAQDAIPKDSTPEAKALAENAVDNALWAFMHFLDGYYRKFTIDDLHSVSYQLLMQVHDKEGNIIETIELAPEGPGLAYGYAGWVQGDFGQEVDN